MIPELGHFVLWIALGVAIVLGVVPMLGAARGRADWMALARPSSRLLFALVAFAFVCLTLSFVRNDFSVAYVATNSNRSLPLPYRIAAVWGGHEGSILLWILMLTLWTLAVATFSRHLPAKVTARILAVMGLLSCGFLLFVLATSNPFDRLVPAAAEGRDLNPLLQDPGMVIHPPMLYMGYVGLSVAFSFAVAALIGGNLDATWARWTRPWTTAAWIFLTIGIALGSAWAYYELGWGGWWFWDPVENASFMPWLVATALIHSLAVTEKRNSFKSWTVLLAILAFSLSLLGTFLVRSGVLSSVHAFATDPRRGLFILAFLVVVIGASLALYAWRAPSVGLGARFALLSRESLLLSNNVLLVVACGAVLLGTLYPLALDAMNLGKISVGPPYFDTVFVPLLTPLVFLMGVGPLARWKEAALPDLATRLKWAAGCAIVATLLVAWLHGGVGIVAATGLLMAFWILSSVATDLIERLRPAGGMSPPGRPKGGFRSAQHAGFVAVASIVHRARQIPRAMVGMMIAHVGIAVFILGVTLVRTGEVERDVQMAPGDTTTIGDLVFTFRGASAVSGPNYRAARGEIEVSRNGRKLTTLRPEKRFYPASESTMTEAAIEPGLTRDLYVSLGEPVGAAWIVRVYVKPFVDWIWGGCLIMAIGGLLAATDRRYRGRARQHETPPLAAMVKA
jgi:cytochrome c-type biogenesis protein CcmF